MSGCRHCGRAGKLYRLGLCWGCYSAPGVRGRCRHCGRAGGKLYRLGLCWGCHSAPGVRGLYPPARRLTGHGAYLTAGHAPPPEPTEARPGTDAKIAVLERRAAAGVSLFHEHDAIFGS